MTNLLTVPVFVVVFTNWQTISITRPVPERADGLGRTEHQVGTIETNTNTRLTFTNHLNVIKLIEMNLDQEVSTNLLRRDVTFYAPTNYVFPAHYTISLPGSVVIRTNELPPLP